MLGLLPRTWAFDSCLRPLGPTCCCSVQNLGLLKTMACVAIVGLKAEGLGLIFHW